MIDQLLTFKDYNQMLLLMDEFKDIIDKVYIYLAGNSESISLIDCYKIMTNIKKQADEIKKLELSPLETIMYVYDQVRNRIYKMETENEPYSKSRDLKEVLFGDKIVCVGYANIFSAILNCLGIDCKVVTLNSNSQEKELAGGHARNVIYIKDSKYNVDGVYYFDPTWDSKKTENNNKYLSSYKYFAKTKSYMDEDSNFKYEDSNLSMYSDNIYEIVESIINNKPRHELIPYSSTIRYMGKLVGENNLITPYTFLSEVPESKKFTPKEFLEKFKKISQKFNKEIPAETMIKLLNNVRKVEYYQNSEWYPYTIDDLYVIAIKSNWNFVNEHLNPEDRLFRALFGEKNNIENSPMDNFINYARYIKLPKEINQIQVTKTLQKVLKKREKS